MYTFTIWYIHWFSIDFSRICTFYNFELFYKSERSIHLMYTIFHWILMILYFQQKQIFQQVWNICTFNIHNFPLNFHDLLRSSIFHQIFTNLYIKQIRIFLLIWTIYTSNVQNFSIEFSQICKFNEFKFLNKFIRSVHLMYIIFHSIFTIWYVLRFSNWNFTILNIQWFWIFHQIRMISALVYSFPLNFHDFVHSTNLNF